MERMDGGSSMKLIIVACVSLFFGVIFGWMMCAVFSINTTNEEWEVMVEELERQRYGEVHQEEPGR